MRREVCIHTGCLKLTRYQAQDVLCHQQWLPWMWRKDSLRGWIVQVKGMEYFSILSAFYLKTEHRKKRKEPSQGRSSIGLKAIIWPKTHARVVVLG